jgi:hypothetical protein
MNGAKPREQFDVVARKLDSQGEKVCSGTLLAAHSCIEADRYTARFHLITNVA